MHTTPTIPATGTDGSVGRPVVDHDHDRERVRLVALMAAMAAGDRGAVFALVAELGHHLAGAVQAQLRGYGRHDLLRERGEVDGLVLTAAFEILDRAGSWNPDGAPPWIWAGHAIRAAVVREIGHASVELDAEHLDSLDHLGHVDQLGPGVVGTDGDLDPFGPGGATDARLRLLGEAIDRIASGRDRLVVRQFLLQKAYGDPSPSRTVAHDLGLTPDNVRQIVSRVRRRVRALGADDDRYHLLGDPGW